MNSQVFRHIMIALLILALGIAWMTVPVIAQAPTTVPTRMNTPPPPAFTGTGIITGCVYKEGKPAAGIMVEAEMQYDALSRIEDAWLTKYGHGTPIKDKSGKTIGFGYSGNDGFSFEYQGLEFATTGPDGTYRIPGVTTAPYDIMVLTPGTTRYTFPQKPWDWVAASSAVTAQDGQTVRANDSILSRGAIISGQVKDLSTGKPLQGIIVDAQGPMCPETSRETISAITDRKGHYSFRIAPGECTLSVNGVVANAQGTTGAYNDAMRFENGLWAIDDHVIAVVDGSAPQTKKMTWLHVDRVSVNTGLGSTHQVNFMLQRGKRQDSSVSPNGRPILRGWLKF